MNKKLSNVFAYQEYENKSEINRAINGALKNVGNVFTHHEFSKNVQDSLKSNRVNITQYRLLENEKAALKKLVKSGYLVKKADFYHVVPSKIGEFQLSSNMNLI